MEIPCLFDNTKNCPNTCRLHKITEQTILELSKNSDEKDINIWISELKSSSSETVRAKAAWALRNILFATTYCPNARESVNQ